MPGPITDPLAPQCGNCKWWDKIPNHPAGNVGDCTGVPPTPVVVGAQPRKFGNGVNYIVELFRPMMATNARPCAHHEMVGVLILQQKGPATPLKA